MQTTSTWPASPRGTWGWAAGRYSGRGRARLIRPWLTGLPRCPSAVPAPHRTPPCTQEAQAFTPTALINLCNSAQLRANACHQLGGVSSGVDDSGATAWSVMAASAAAQEDACDGKGQRAPHFGEVASSFCEPPSARVSMRKITEGKGRASSGRQTRGAPRRGSAPGSGAAPAGACPPPRTAPPCTRPP